MGGRRRKFKKLFDGSPATQWQPEDFVIYLDENLCNCAPLLAVLRELNVRHERHLQHFRPGLDDDVWLPAVGSKKWVLLTTDKGFRYNQLEKRAFRRYKVRAFEFSRNNIGGEMMAAALRKAIPIMKRLAEKTSGCLLASITKDGNVTVKWPRS